MSITAVTHRVSPRAAEGNRVHHAKRLLLIFWSVLPIALGRRRPLKSKMGPGSSFSREAQEYLLYCNARIYTRAEHMQGEGTSPSVLPALEMRLPRGLTPRCQVVKALN